MVLRPCGVPSLHRGKPDIDYDDQDVYDDDDDDGEDDDDNEFDQ